MFCCFLFGIMIEDNNDELMEVIMEEKLMSDKVFRVMFYLMTLALVILALRPTKVIVLGSANDNHGTIKIDVKSRKRRKKSVAKDVVE